MKAFVANPSCRKAKKQQRRSRRNLLPLVIGNPHRIGGTKMSAKKKNRAGAGKARRSHARKNPAHRRIRRSYRNPDFVGQSLLSNTVMVGGATGGLLGDIYLPAWLLKLINQPDTGTWSYILAALAVVLPAWLFHKINWPNVAKGWLAGAGAGFVWRAIDDATGANYVVVQSGMGSFIQPASVPLPGANMFGQYARKALPAGSIASPMAVAAPVSKGVGYVKYPYAA